MQDPWLPGWDNSSFSSQALIPFKSPPQTPLPTRREPNPPVPPRAHAAPPRAPPAQPTSAAQSKAGRGPARSCHISMLSQELYHMLVAHVSLHQEIKQVGGGTAARCHRALPHAGSRRAAGPHIPAGLPTPSLGMEQERKAARCQDSASSPKINPSAPLVPNQKEIGLKGCHEQS